MGIDLDDAAADAVLDLMDFGRERHTDVGTPQHPAVLAYEHLFFARFDSALEAAKTLDAHSGYESGVRRQIEALCAGSVTSAPDTLVVPEHGPPLDTATAMRVFHSSEAAHVIGNIELCTTLTSRALGRGVDNPRAQTWLRFGLVRGLLFQGEVTRAAGVLAEGEATTPLAIESQKCLKALVSGLSGERSTVVELAESLSRRMVAPSTYADAGLALIGAFGLAASGLPQNASELLRYGGGGPGLPLLPLALRAYGYDMLVEAAVAAGNADLAAWMMLDFDRIDLGRNRQMLSARETARARLRIATGDRADGAAQARAATAAALESGSALVGARAALTATLADLRVPSSESEAIETLLGQVSPADLRVWLVRALDESGRHERSGVESRWAHLTPTQQVVARLAARGLRNQQIADVLVVSLRTVEGHVAAVLDTLGVPNRIGIVVHAPDARDALGTRLHALTPRQRDVALGLMKGHTNDEIARDLGISQKAVEAHVRGLFRALGATSRAGVVARLLDVS